MRKKASLLLIFLLLSILTFSQTSTLLNLDVDPILKLYPYEKVDDPYRKKVNEIISLKIIEKKNNFSVFYLTPFGIFKNMISGSGDILMEPICLVEFFSEKTFFYEEISQFDVEFSDDSYFIVGPEFKFDHAGGLNVWKFDSNDNSLLSKSDMRNTFSTFNDLLIISDDIIFLSLFQEASRFSNEISKTFLFKSTDGGKTWHESEIHDYKKCFSMEFDTTENSVDVCYVDISSDENSINLMKFDLASQNWSNPKELIRTTNDILSVKMVITNSNEKWIIYNEKIAVDENFEQSEIFYIKSTNEGISWSQPNHFTRYMGEDILINVSKGEHYPFTLFSSTRQHFQRESFYVGLLGNHIDNGPPYFQSIFTPTLNSDSTKYILRTKVMDYDKISSVVFQNEKIAITLYDDGENEDSLLNDNIYSGMINQSDFLLESLGAIVDINNLKFPFKINGALAGTKAQAKFEYSATDVANNNMAKIGSHPFGKFGAKFSGNLILYSAGFLLSGYHQNELWINGMASLEWFETYKAGQVGSDPSDLINRIYKVEKEDPPFGFSWQEWRNAVAQGAYFYDGNKNGKYDPIDDNGNGIWEPSEDRPDLLYDVTYFSVFNDGIPPEIRQINGEPLGIEIRQTVFASSSIPELENTVLIRYSIFNTGIIADTLENVIFSIYANPEIGHSSRYDDMIGCDTTLQSGFAYNNGDDDRLGVNPPSIFQTLLQGPIKTTNKISDQASFKYGQLIGEQNITNSINQRMFSHTTNHRFIPDYIDDPSTDKHQLRNKIEGNSSNGEVIDPCSFVFGKVENFDCNEVNPRFLFSGDPVQNKGWLCNHAVWQRQMTSTGLFNLIKGEPQDIIVAYTVGQGDTHLSSITDARERVQFVFEEYNNNFPNSYTPLNYEEIYPKEFSLSQNYPNPFNPSTTIKFTVPLDVKRETSNTKLVVYDILGREVKTLVNENRTSGSYEITFDASQLASGVYFYRLTSGSFMQTKKMILLR